MKLFDTPELKSEFFSIMIMVAGGYLTGTIGAALLTEQTFSLFSILFRIGFGILIILGVPFLFLWGAKKMRQRMIRKIQQEMDNRQAENQFSESQEGS